jgi:glycine hydroxymethyltransferase
MITSGIRIGTPAMTTRGMKEKEMEEIGKFILRVIDNINNESELLKIKEEVRELCLRFPLYQ